MNKYKILGSMSAVSKAGKPYTKVSIAEDNNPNWAGVHAFEAFVRSESNVTLKAGDTVTGVVTYVNGGATLNV